MLGRPPRSTLSPCTTLFRSFAIDGTTGVVTVANGTLLDAETSTSHDITVLATSSDGSTNSQTFTVAVTSGSANVLIPPTGSDRATAAPSTENPADGTALVQH